MKRNRLKCLKVKEVSLVDRPCNQPAKVVLYKRHELINNDIIQEETRKSLSRGVEEAMPKTLEELQKALDEQTAANAELKAQVEKSKTDSEALQKQFDQVNAQLDEVKKALPKEQIDKAAEEDLKKGMSEEVRKRFEALEKDNKEAQEKLAAEVAKRQETELTKRAEADYPNLPGEPVQKGKLLGAIEKMADSEKEFALSVLKSANESLSKAMEEIGSSASPEAVSAKEKLNKMADEMSTAQKITKAQAYDRVIQTAEGKKLYEEASK